MASELETVADSLQFTPHPRRHQTRRFYRVVDLCELGITKTLETVSIADSSQTGRIATSTFNINTAASGRGLAVLVRRFSHAPICCNEVRFKVTLREYHLTTGEFLTLMPSLGVIHCEYRHK